MTIVYRNQKGIPLTSNEIDNNFKEIIDRLESLENLPPVGEGIAKINKVGEELEFIGTYGTIFGRFKLSAFCYTPQGRWESDKAYYLHDLVTIKDQVWICINAHRSVEQFENHNWRIFLDLSSFCSH